MSFPDYMNKTEQRIVGKLIRAALDKGFKVSVYDGEEWPLKMSTDYEAITKEVAATDATWLRFRHPDNTKIGSVFLVHGNEDDVIVDYHDNPTLEELVNHAI